VPEFPQPFHIPEMFTTVQTIHILMFFNHNTSQSTTQCFQMKATTTKGSPKYIKSPHRYSISKMSNFYN